MNLPIYERRPFKRPSLKTAIFYIWTLFTVGWVIVGLWLFLPTRKPAQANNDSSGEPFLMSEQQLPETAVLLDSAPLGTTQIAAVESIDEAQFEMQQVEETAVIPTPQTFQAQQSIINQRPIPAEQAHPPIPLQKHNVAPLANAQIIIPTLGINHTITHVPVRDGQWDITALDTQIGHLQTTGVMPGGDQAMTFIGHASLPWPGIGPFADLIRLEHGEEIIYRWNGTDYIYKVSRILLVDPNHVEALYEADGTMLMLATCSGWDFVDREYAKRLVTRATLIRTEPSPIVNLERDNMQ